jgi:7-carboxy-7-deazaguanine synthase
MKAMVPIEAAAGTLRVTEAYDCVEGEGKTAGARTFLVRLSGCNLRCWWCDSKYSSFDESEAVEIPWFDLIKTANRDAVAWLSITGGEPTWRSKAELESLARLCREAGDAGLKVKIETNGLALPAELQD